MIILQAIAVIIGYIIISILTTIFFVYLDRKAGEPAQKVYKEDSFYDYCIVGFLFPITLPSLVIVGISKFIKIMCVAIVEKFIKIMCVAIVETKIAIDEDKE